MSMVASNPVLSNTTTSGAPPAITVTVADFERLGTLLASYDEATSERLDEELSRAQVVPEREVPPDVVTMNSEVQYEDVVTGALRQVRIVYPKDADAEHGKISVLAPLGSALLGLRVGQSIDWTMPSGARHLRVVAVPYQPEANGEFAP